MHVTLPDSWAYGGYPTVTPGVEGVNGTHDDAMAGGPLVNPPGTGRHGGPGMITERGSGPYNVMITTLAAPACQRLPSRGMAEVRRVATSSGLVSLFTSAAGYGASWRDHPIRSNAVPALLLSPVFNRNVVPELLPGRQQRDDVVVEIGDKAAAPGHRSCWTPLPAAALALGLPQARCQPRYHHVIWARARKRCRVSRGELSHHG